MNCSTTQGMEASYMTDITIEHTTFERLQRHAQPLVDSSDAVINRALDALEGHTAERRAKASST